MRIHSIIQIIKLQTHHGCALLIGMGWNTVVQADLVFKEYSFIILATLRLYLKFYSFQILTIKIRLAEMAIDFKGGTSLPVLILCMKISLSGNQYEKITKAYEFPKRTVERQKPRPGVVAPAFGRQGQVDLCEVEAVWFT